jgi:hypothetical protein
MSPLCRGPKPASCSDSSCASSPHERRRRGLARAHARYGRGRSGRETFGDPPRFSGLLEGGSAATGRLDEHSDIDFGMIADPAPADPVFAAAQAAASTVGRIAEVCPVIDSPWPGLVQRFYLFETAPPFFMLALRPAATACVGVFPTALRRLA